MIDQMVSIVIPAYNTETYIGRCVESLLHQDYENIEIIVVNDGSTDSTSQVLKEFKSITVVNQNNRGSASARNTGIKVAQGKWIMFVDSDDWVDPDFVSAHVRESSGSEDEIIMSGLVVGDKLENVHTHKELVGIKNVFAEYLAGGICNKIMNKLYPLCLVQDVLFPEGRNVMEDAVWTSRVLEKCHKLVCIPYYGYHYERREGSLTKHRLSKNELCGRMSNILNKDLILCKYVKGEQIIKRLLEDIHLVLLSCCEIDKYGIADSLKCLSKKCLETGCFISIGDYHLCLMLVNTDSDQIKNKYIFHILFRTCDIKKKMKLLRNMLIYCFRA